MNYVDVTLMNHALTVALDSRDASVQNGAVVAQGGYIIGEGVNGLPPGVHHEPERWERPDKYLWVEHAERAAIQAAAREGIRPTDTLYCPWAACADCARAIIGVGVARLVRLPMGPAEGWDRSIEVGDEMMREAGVEIVTLPFEAVRIPEGLRLGQWRKL